MGFFKSHKSRYGIMIGLSIFFCLVEFVIGQMSNSIALVADSFHMLSDTLSLIVGMVSISFALMASNKDSRFTFGYSRSSAMGGFINGVFLMSLVFHILASAIKKLLHPSPVHNPSNVFITGGIGLFINVIGFLVFHQDSLGTPKDSKEDAHATQHHHDSERLLPKEETGGTVEEASSRSPGHLREDGAVKTHSCRSGSCHGHGHGHGQLNMKGVLLHIIGDAIGSVFVLITTGLTVYFKGSRWVLYLDPVMSLILVCIITYTTAPLIRQTSDILVNVNGEEKTSLVNDRLQALAETHKAVIKDVDVIQLSENEFAGSCRAHFAHPLQRDLYKSRTVEIFREHQVNHVFVHCY